MLAEKESAEKAATRRASRRPLKAKPQKYRVDIEAMCQEVKERYPNILARLAE